MWQNIYLPFCSSVLRPLRLSSSSDCDAAVLRAGLVDARLKTLLDLLLQQHGMNASKIRVQQSALQSHFEWLDVERR